MLGLEAGWPQFVFYCCFFVALGQAGEVLAKQPNFLIIMADDCTYNDLPLYGGSQNAKTPNIDRPASRGWRLTPILRRPCASRARAELMTGQYPLHNGCAWNHSASQPDVKSMPAHLGALGYRVGIAGKVHVKPASAFPFESIAGFDPNCVRNPRVPMSWTASPQLHGSR